MQKNKNCINSGQIKDYFSTVQYLTVGKRKITSPGETGPEPPGTPGASGSKSFNDTKKYN